MGQISEKGGQYGPVGGLGGLYFTRIHLYGHIWQYLGLVRVPLTTYYFYVHVGEILKLGHHLHHISPRARMAVCDWSLNGHVPFTSTIEPAVLRGRINILPAG